MATLGWSVKVSTEFTNTPSFTQRLTRSRSPNAAFTWASTLMAHSRAAALPSSTFMSRPTTPTCFRPSGAEVICPDTNSRFPLVTVGT